MIADDVGGRLRTYPLGFIPRQILEDLTVWSSHNKIHVVSMAVFNLAFEVLRLSEVNSYRISTAVEEVERRISSRPREDYVIVKPKRLRSPSSLDRYNGHDEVDDSEVGYEHFEDLECPRRSYPMAPVPMRILEDLSSWSGRTKTEIFSDALYNLAYDVIALAEGDEHMGIPNALESINTKIASRPKEDYVLIKPRHLAGVQTPLDGFIFTKEVTE